jgi:hypothetical protein
MRKEYDFTHARRNPYARRLKKPITLRLDEETIAYFKRQCEPYADLASRNWEPLEARSLASICA